MADLEVKEAPPAAKEKRHVRQIEIGRWRQAESERTVYVITAFENTEPEDLLQPDYWAHIANKLSPWDHVEARADDGSWWAEYLVLAVDRAWARMAMLRKVSLSTADVSLSQSNAFEVRHRGPASKWSVVRLSDKAVLFEGGQQRTDAESWLLNHQKSQR